MVLSRVTGDPRLRGVRFAVVTSRRDALAAASLVHDAYVGRGVLAPHPTGVHVSPLSASPCNWAFIATLDGEPIGTISMVVDSEVGLPMETIYADEIRALRATGVKLAEVGAFAVAPRFRGTGLVFPLMWTMWRLALELGVDRFVAAVHPDAAWFYSDLLSFARFGETRLYPGLDASALAVALVSPRFEAIEERYTRLFSIVWPAGSARAADGTEASSRRRAARQALMRVRPDVIPRRPSLLGEVTATLEAG